MHANHQVCYLSTYPADLERIAASTLMCFLLWSYSYFHIIKNVSKRLLSPTYRHQRRQQVVALSIVIQQCALLWLTNQPRKSMVKQHQVSFLTAADGMDILYYTIACWSVDLNLCSILRLLSEGATFFSTSIFIWQETGFELLITSSTKTSVLSCVTKKKARPLLVTWRMNCTTISISRML